MIEAIHLFFTDAAYFKSAMTTFFFGSLLFLLFSPLIALAVYAVVGMVRDLFDE